MPEFIDRFDRAPGPVGNDWIVAAGEQRILTSGQVELVYAGHPRYEGRTYEEPTAGAGWQLKDAGSFPHAAWRGNRMLDIYYGYEANVSGGRLDRTDAKISTFEKVYAEWEVGGLTYGRSTNAPPNDYIVNLQAVDLPVAGERYIRLLAADQTTLVDRFRYPEIVGANEDFFPGYYAGLTRKFMAATNGQWECELTGFCEGAQYENWGEMTLVFADAAIDVDATFWIGLELDVGGYIAVSYLNAQGTYVRLGSSSANDGTFAYLDAQSNALPTPDSDPQLEFKYLLTVNPTTGVVAVVINGSVRGSVTIPEDEMARMRARYSEGAYMGYGLSGYVFGEIRDTFVVTSFRGAVPHPPIVGDHAGRRAAFVGPAY